MTKLEVMVAMRKYSNAARALEEAELVLVQALEQQNLYNQSALEFIKSQSHGSLLELRAFVEKELGFV